VLPWYDGLGRSIDKPQVATAQILLKPGKRITDVGPSAEAIIGEELQNINRFCLEMAEGKYQVC
jgi:S-adenosylmethionine synthetase